MSPVKTWSAEISRALLRSVLPAEYGESGILTCIVTRQERVCQKDPGRKTGKPAPAMNVHDPDPSWSVSKE